MRFDENPTHRAIIIPWYDSQKSCLLMILFMLLVFFFSITGVFAVGEYAEYNRYLWVPVLLCVMSGMVIVSTIIRMIKRLVARRVH